MSNDKATEISPSRLRIGVVLIFIWWVPIWVIAPQLADIFSFNAENARIVIMVIQTIIGVIGMLIVGKQIASIMRDTPFKKMIPKVWHIIRHGSID